MFRKVEDVKKHFENNKYAPEVHEAIELLLCMISDVEAGEFVGRTIDDFFCNGFFGRRYDLSGSVIIENGTDYIEITTPDGDILRADFEDTWASSMREMVDKWTQRY